MGEREEQIDEGAGAFAPPGQPPREVAGRALGPAAPSSNAAPGIWGQQVLLLWPAVRNFYIDSATTTAAALAFLALFSGFPLLLLAVLLASAVLPTPDVALRVREVLTEYVPFGSGLVEQAIRGTVERGAFAIGLPVVALLWAGTRVFGLVVRTVNDAWGVEKTYSMRTRLLLDPMLGLTAVALLAAGLLSDYAATLASGRPGGQRGILWGAAGFLIPKLVALVVTAAVYRYLPRTTAVRWRHALRGALLFVLLFQLAQSAFLWIRGAISERYTEVYGPLGQAAVMLLWAYIVAVAFLLGAEYASAHRVREERRPMRKAIATVPPETYGGEIEPDAPGDGAITRPAG